jgi:hypothetical protein
VYVVALPRALESSWPTTKLRHSWQKPYGVAHDPARDQKLGRAVERIADLVVGAGQARPVFM